MKTGFRIISQRLENVLFFKDVTWKFESGLSVVYGLNRATVKTSGNGNGAGKSAFFSMMGEILYEDPIVGEKQDAVKSGRRTIKGILNDKKIDIIREGNKLDIKIDGKSKFRTKPLAAAWLKKNLPIDQEAYGTYVHLDARVPHPLVMGSSTIRKKFFTSFFGLDKLDIERKLFQAELTKLGKIRAAYNEVKSEYLRAKEKVGKSNIEELKRELKETRTELEELHEKNARVQNITQLLAFEKSAKAQIEEFMVLCPNGVDDDIFTELMESARWNLKTNKADLVVAQEWEQYLRDTRHYNKAFEKLSNNAKTLFIKYGKEECLNRWSSSADDAMHMRVSIKETTDNIKAYKKILNEELPEKVEISDKWNRKEIRASIESLEHQYSHAKKFKSGACETCGQSVKIDDPETIKARYQKEKKKLKLLDQYSEYEEKLAARLKAKQELKKATSYLEELEPEHSKLQRYAEIVAEIANCPERPVAFKGKKLEAAVLQRMVDEDRSRIQLLEFIHPNLDTIKELIGLNDKQRKASAIADKLQIKINVCQERIGKLRLALGLCKEAAIDYSRLRIKVKEMKASLADEEALKLLVEGYSDKAMKKMAIKTIASRLMQEINKYGRIVFPEDYTFDFEWDKSQMALVVTRKHGKKVLKSDVRKLSGAESKLFTHVLVMALMTFVPKAKRCNVLVLDEPAATFSLETLDAFRRLLPIMNKLFPSIILITPRTDERYENAREYTVLKEKHTQILEGHPSMHKRRK